MKRRQFLAGSGLAFGGLAMAGGALAAPGEPGPVPRKLPPLAPMKSAMDRILSVESCSRPFRTKGPRIEAERVGGKTVIHNYGHGGAGWSLSWGSGRVAVELAKATREPRVAIIGCGAIGLTTALVAQRAGLKVRIYTKEYMPFVRSFRASGQWSPSARVCTTEHATPELRRRWEQMARYSYFMWNSFLGLPGSPVEWISNYKVSDKPFATGTSLYTHKPFDGEPEYPHLEDDHTPDLMSGMDVVAPGDHPFAVPHVRRGNNLIFNIPAYGRMLMSDFLAHGGELVIREFDSVRQFASLPERTIIHSTGYAAKVLAKDDAMVPVKGTTAKLIPQPEVDYGLAYEEGNIYTIPRRDALVLQFWTKGDYGNESEIPDMANVRGAVERLAKFYAQFGGARTSGGGE